MCLNNNVVKLFTAMLYNSTDRQTCGETILELFYSVSEICFSSSPNLNLLSESTILKPQQLLIHFILLSIIVNVND